MRNILRNINIIAHDKYLMSFIRQIIGLLKVVLICTTVVWAVHSILNYKGSGFYVTITHVLDISEHLLKRK